MTYRASRRDVMALLGGSPVVAACGAAATTKPAAVKRAVNVEFLHADGPPQKEKLERVVDAFKARNPGSQVNMVYTPWGEFETKIVSLHTAGTPPDFHQIDDDAVPFFAMRDLLLPVDPVLKDNAISKGEYHKMV